MDEDIMEYCKHAEKEKGSGRNINKFISDIWMTETCLIVEALSPINHTRKEKSMILTIKERPPSY